MLYPYDVEFDVTVRVKVRIAAEDVPDARARLAELQEAGIDIGLAWQGNSLNETWISQIQRVTEHLDPENVGVDPV